MTAEEKSTLYNLLKTAAAWCEGAAPAAFPEKDPVFYSDASVMPQPVLQAEKPAEAQEGTAAQKGMTLEKLAHKIGMCKNCSLSEERTLTVPGEGVEHPVVLVVGEGPGHDEDVSGRPFVGAAGQLLDKMLFSIGLSRTTNCFIANIVKCRPPKNRTPHPEECSACMGYLEAQIHILKPKMILAMGGTAAKNLLQTEQGVNALRGKFHDYHGIPLLVSYHPSALLRDASLKRPAWEDLKQFRSTLLQLVPDYETKQC